MTDLPSPSQVDPIAIGQRLAEVRITAGRSQQAFAEALGVSHRCYANYERGVREVSVGVIKAAHEVFGADVLWLLRGGPGAPSAPSDPPTRRRASAKPAKPRSAGRATQSAAVAERRRVAHERIKTRLRLADSSFAKIARELEVTCTTVTAVSQGRARSRRIEERIASVLKTTPERLWPDRYAEGPAA